MAGKFTLSFMPAFSSNDQILIFDQHEESSCF